MTVDGVVASDMDVVLQASEDADNSADVLLLNSVAQVSGDDVILRAGDQIDVRSGATVTAQTDMTLRTEYDAGIDTGNGQIDVAGSLTVGGDLAVRSSSGGQCYLERCQVTVTGDTQFTNGRVSLVDTDFTTTANGSIQSEFDVDADTSLMVSGVLATAHLVRVIHNIDGVIDGLPSIHGHGRR